jgi:hypothetical protein
VNLTGTNLRVLQEEIMTQDGDLHFIGNVSKYLKYLKNEETSKILLKEELMFSLVRK